MNQRFLSIVVSGAGPAAHVDRLVVAAQAQEWDVTLIATPAGLGFIDVESLAALTGAPIRSQYRNPGEPRSRPSDAFILAPATYNTINKLAAGISDTYALGVLAEAIGLGLPVVVLPFLNTALACRTPFKRSVEALSDDGVQILLGPGAIEPHPPHAGGHLIDSYPWELALERLES